MLGSWRAKTFIYFEVPLVLKVLKWKGQQMSGKPDYTKVNATRQSTHVLNILAAERAKPVYVVLDEILRENFKEYFRKIGYWKKTKQIRQEKTKKRTEKH